MNTNWCETGLEPLVDLLQGARVAVDIFRDGFRDCALAEREVDSGGVCEACQLFLADIAARAARAVFM